ncbi:MAG: hypothetical protein OYH76_00005 [Defluviicoccus sp.]|nr:hypothetical protein [Defluviicoccus sp.]MDE0274245.1 hypothetical protein [Defluviicoccus sp.]
MTLPGIDKAMEHLIAWSGRDPWAARHAEIFAFHIDPFADTLEEPAEDIAALLGEDFHVLAIFICEDFFTAYFGEDADENVIDEYLQRRGWRETAAARLYLEGFRDSAVSLYEVVGIDPGRSLTVRDLLRGGEAVRVEEKLGSCGAAMWDRLAARIVEVKGRRYFTGAMLQFDHALSREAISRFDELVKEASSALRNEARRLGVKPPPRAFLRETAVRDLMGAEAFSEYWLGDILLRAGAPPPELRNTDGEPMVFCEVRFPVAGDRAEIAAALDRIDDFEADGEGCWRWLAPGSPPERAARLSGRGIDPALAEFVTSLGAVELGTEALILSANSTERAERGRAMLAARLGRLVGPPLVTHQDPERALEEHAGAAPEEPVDLPEEALAAMRSMLDDRYRRSLDEPIPMLDGRTPREAAATRKGRKRAIDWLKQLENAEHRRALQLGDEPCDTSWIWRELELPAPG